LGADVLDADVLDDEDLDDEDLDFELQPARMIASENAPANVSRFFMGLFLCTSDGEDDEVTPSGRQIADQSDRREFCVYYS